MEPLIYIEQKDKDEASLLLRGFTNQNIRKRAYINALGAELLMKFLSQEGISVSNIYNMHDIFKVREEFDVADVMLPNIHIDVRVVYDKEVIFIPKSHFEHNLVPDVYVIFNMAQDSTHVDFLGFIKPEKIDKSKQNSDYYFVDKEQLIHPFEFIEFVRNFEGNTTETFADDLYSDAISLIDNDITDSKKSELIEALKKSAALREEMIEFDNFEWLSYNASKGDIIDAVTTEQPSVDEFDLFEQKDEFDIDNNADKQLENDINITEDADLLLEGTDTVPELDETTDVSEDLSDLSLGNVDEVPELDEAANVTDGLSDLSLGNVDEVPELDEAADVTDGLSDLSLGNVDEVPELDEAANVTDGLSDLSLPEEDLSLDVEPLDITEDSGVELSESNSVELQDDLGTEDIKIEEDSSFNAELPDETERTEITESTISDHDEVEEEGFVGEIENITDSTDTDNDVAVSARSEENDENLANLEELLSLTDMPVQQNAPAANESFEELMSLDDITFDNPQPVANDSVGTNPEALEDLIEMESYNSSESDMSGNGSNNITGQQSVDELASYENTNLISSGNKTPGEIPIDINAPEQENIGVLYNNSDSEAIEHDSVKMQEKGKKAVMVAAAAVAAVMIAASSAYFYFNNNKQPEVAETTAVIPEPEPKVEEQPVPQEVIPEAPAEKTVVEATKPAPVKGKPIESAYMEVKKMGWSVPDYVSYNDNFKHYLQTLGKSLRLALSSDLLLATEYPYSDQIFVDIELLNDGSANNIVISKSSGSKQIDGIVLRTVKETANVVKPPAGVIVGDKFKMTLKIYL